ncbi:O-antigen biosynthesis protein WlbD [soil metagenome]
MTHVTTVVGARPQFIKAAVVSLALANRGVHEEIVHTGQHYDVAMSDAFFDELGIPAPAHSLAIGSGPHGEQTGAMLAAIEQVLVASPPDVVLVYGDTNSTLAGALAAAKLHIPVAHVEAGLRSFNRRMPEEINRVVTDHLSDVLFAPTDAAVAHLASEGIGGDHVHTVGDVMFDLALITAARLDDVDTRVARFGLERYGYVLATVHRAENTDDPDRLGAIIGGLREVAATLPVVLPVHPRTRKLLAAMPEPGPRGVTVIDPVGYADMVSLEMLAAVVATDSGGVQKEAFFHARPCVTLRDETEWTELVDLGWNRVVPPTSAGAVATAVLEARGRRGQDAAPYGTGDAGARIAAVLAQLP